MSNASTRKLRLKKPRKRCTAESQDKHRTAGRAEKRGKNMDPKAILDHQFTVAAYAITWAVQLAYLAWLGFRWRAQKRDAARSSRNPR